VNGTSSHARDSVTPIVALDVPDAARARAIVAQLGDSCDFYKVGLQLFSAEGPAVVRWLREAGKQVFVDLKLHDIPNTVRQAAHSVARHGASLLTVHASGGTAMIRAAVEGAQEASGDGCGILAVTILTSLTPEDVEAAWAREPVVIRDEVVRLAGFARDAAAAGVVCSGHEAAAVREAYGGHLGALVPGIRLPGGDAHDQQRIMTPAEAARAGARWVVIGRAVTGASDPQKAMMAVRTALAEVA
jgi:orotidine-5'-phosphate decarboxylase